MSATMKTIYFGKNNRSNNCLHIETEGGIVNIRVGLQDREGRKVTSIEILPDKYCGEEWELSGVHNNRLIKVEHESGLAYFECQPHHGAYIITSPAKTGASFLLQSEDNRELFGEEFIKNGAGYCPDYLLDILTENEVKT